MSSPIWPLLRSFSWQEIRQHPWRHAVALLAIALGVGLALSVHWINASALAEFAQAARTVGGEPDLELRPTGLDTPTLPQSLIASLAQHPDVETASPILVVDTLASPPGASAPGAPATRLPLRIVGVDAWSVRAVTPGWMPRPFSGEDPRVVFAPQTAFVNANAQRSLQGPSFLVQQGLQLHPVRIGGTVAATGPPLAVMDIAAVQDLFGLQGNISRIDLRLRPGVDRDRFAQELRARSTWPAGVRLTPPGESMDRLGAMSRAYRVNLTVLALVALFTGGFLVFSVLTLSVSRRGPQWALLGVLGLTARERLQLVLLEASVLGLVGSGLGVALGTGLAAAALHFLGGDLGGGYFAASTPTLQWSPGAAIVFGGLGLVAAWLGAWQPARWAQNLSVAQALKGVGAVNLQDRHAPLGAVLLAGGALLALLPPLGGIPVAAYLSVAALLMGGITILPWLVGQTLDRLAPYVQQRSLPLLAVERARRVRASASVAVSGVVAALSLAAALTIMVTSFRASVTQWLDQVLPADLYVRTATATAAQQVAFLSPAFVEATRQLPGVARIVTQRTQRLLLNPALPPVTLIAGSVSALPWLDAPLAVPPTRIGVHVSEALVDLYGLQLGTDFPQLAEALRPLAQTQHARDATFFIAGIWRDYGRQFGTVAIDSADYLRWSGDTRVNDIALWLVDPSAPAPVEQSLRVLAREHGQIPQGDAGDLLEFASAQSIRASSLRIFDRSFAVTVWLQAVAVGIGLFGVAASFSAQVLARRKEFGLLAHLGLTRRQILQVVALEAAAWTTLGAVAGLALGAAVAVVLVKVVNPQSFHWTMEMSWPWWRLAGLAVGVVVAGTVTAALSARAAGGRDAVLAVKEDW